MRSGPLNRVLSISNRICVRALAGTHLDNEPDPTSTAWQIPSLFTLSQVRTVSQDAEIAVSRRQYRFMRLWQGSTPPSAAERWRCHKPFQHHSSRARRPVAALGVTMQSKYGLR